MKNNFRKLLSVVVAGLFSYALLCQQALAIPVSFVNVSPGQVVTIDVNAFGYTGGVYAGIYNLLVDGTPTPSLCIDVFRFADTSPEPYSVLPLASSPLTPNGPMGAAAALEVQKLWALYDMAALGNATIASDLQIAVWYAVANGITPYAFHVQSDAGALAMLLAANSYSGPLPDLVGIASPDHQNYVMQVPDGGLTISLLGFAMVGIEGLRRKLAR